jgi:hypothetical protein
MLEGVCFESNEQIAVRRSRTIERDIFFMKEQVWCLSKGNELLVEIEAILKVTSERIAS